MKKIIILVLMLCFPVMVFADSITKTDLEEGIRNFFASDSSQTPEYTVTDDEITITSDGSTAKFNYVIENDYITFTKSYTVNNGVSYEDFKKGTDSLSDVYLGYAIVASYKGVSTEKISSYLFSNLFGQLGTALENAQNNNDYITIVSGDVTTSGNYIREEEFPARAVEVAKVNFKPSEYRDNVDERFINCMYVKLEQLNETTDSIDLVETLKLDLNADYSKLNTFEGIIEQLQQNDQLSGSDVINDVYDNYQNKEETIESAAAQPESTSNVENPKTGINKYTYMLGIGVIAIGAILTLNRKKLFKNI